MARKQSNAAKRMKASLQLSKARLSTKRVKAIASRVVDAKAETKMVGFFNGPVAATSPPANSNGWLADALPVAQNQIITSNPTDILKLIPDVSPGNGDNQRTGRYIMPTAASVRCKVMLAPNTTGSTGWASPQISAYDLTFVAYLLQSVSFKNYRDLYVENDFGKMLDDLSGGTCNFDGSYSAANLPVEKGYYKVLAKKRKQLRSSGLFTAPGGVITQVSNNNSAPLVHEWTWNLKKHLPKKLIYPESTVSVAQGQNEPLNSSIFWCVGYYRTDGTGRGGSDIILNQEYTSIMKYKDF